MEKEEKAFWKSQTFWSAIASMAAVTVPRYSGLINDTVVHVISIVGMISPIWTIIGRWRAQAKLGWKDKPAQPLFPPPPSFQ